jgi:hypothetical protein
MTESILTQDKLNTLARISGELEFEVLPDLDPDSKLAARISAFVAYLDTSLNFTSLNFKVVSTDPDLCG